MIKKVLLTSGHYFLGSLVGKVLSTLTFIVLAKLLLPEGLGQVALFTTTADVITVFSSFGLTQWYLKHVTNEAAEVTFQKVLVARAILFGLTIAIALPVLLLLHPFSFVISACLLVILGSESLLSIGDGYFLAKAEVWKVTSKVTSKMLCTLAGVAVLFLLGLPITAERVIVLYVLGSILTMLWFFPWHVLTPFRTIRLDGFPKIIKGSVPYAALIGTSFFYARADWFVVQKFLGSASLGIYSAAYRYLEAVSLLPAALTQNLFPLAAKREGVRLHQVVKITAMMATFGAVTGVVLFTFAGPLTIGLLGQAYAPAQSLVQIFAVAVFLFFVNSPLSTIVQSSDLVKKFLPFGVLNTVLNVVLNIIVVPRFGLAAAAYVMVFTEVSGLLVNVWFVSKIYRAVDSKRSS